VVGAAGVGDVLTREVSISATTFVVKTESEVARANTHIFVMHVAKRGSLALRSAIREALAAGLRSSSLSKAVSRNNVAHVNR
jgi:hypothetical protein